MSDLPERLRSWAQNEEMIDQHFTEHGADCMEAADLLESGIELLEELDAENHRLRSEYNIERQQARITELERDRNE